LEILFGKIGKRPHSTTGILLPLTRTRLERPRPSWHAQEQFQQPKPKTFTMRKGKYYKNRNGAMSYYTLVWLLSWSPCISNEQALQKVNWKVYAIILLKFDKFSKRGAIYWRQKCTLSPSCWYLEVYYLFGRCLSHCASSSLWKKQYRRIFQRSKLRWSCVDTGERVLL
jgi:hypothetical protein